MNETGANIFVITGTSSSGKKSVIEEFKKRKLDFSYIVTTTTRPKHNDETEGQDYYFVSHDEFMEKVKNNELVEFSTVYGNYYGATKQEIEEKLKLGKPVIWKVDQQGVDKIKALYPQAVPIFIKAPDIETLEKWIKDSFAGDIETAEQRLAVAKKEMENLINYDHIVVNQDGRLNDTVEQVLRIIESYQK